MHHTFRLLFDMKSQPTDYIYRPPCFDSEPACTGKGRAEGHQSTHFSKYGRPVLWSIFSVHPFGRGPVLWLTFSFGRRSELEGRVARRLVKLMDRGAVEERGGWLPYVAGQVDRMTDYHQLMAEG